MCRNGVRNAKAWLELNLAKYAKTDMQGSLTNKNGNFVSTDEEKAEVIG